MTTRHVLSIVFGTILLFVWNAVSWMALPFHNNSLTNIPEAVIQVDSMRSLMPESGVYHYPGMPTDFSGPAMERVEAQLAKGPRITLMVYKNEPTSLFDPKTFGISLIINAMTVFFTYLLLVKMAIQAPKGIMTACLLIGLVAVLLSDISQMNWFMFPLGYTLVNALDKLIAFGLLGLLFSMYTFKKPNHAG
ncbi:MAG: hypothetical protein AAFV80_23070 [Bacteroidota bacterium]